MADDAVYVIADTHLGLRERGGKRSRDDPATVAGFLRWLSRIPPEGVPIPVLGPSGIEPKTLRPPARLILLGDILELWDSENATLLLSAASVLPALSGLRAPVAYVLGNHDNILATSEGSYPVTAATMQVLPDTFPPAGPDGRVLPLRIGEHSFVFVHGHQLDRFFMASRGTWKWLGHVRQLGAAMGSYAWLLAVLALVTAVVLTAIAPGLVGWFLVAGLVLLVFPRIYMTVARPLYDLRGLRYRRAAAREGFRKWWSRFRANVTGPDDTTVVYGHTHVLDYFRGGREAEAGSRGGNAVYNISSWVSVGGGYETVTRATFLYADASGPLFFGWDWSALRPFHIPEGYASLRGTRRLTADEAGVADRLGWPAPLLAKWTDSDEKTRTLWPFGQGARRQRRKGGA